MTGTIPSLWPDDISVPVLSPLRILRTQEAALEKQTGGMLRGKLSTVESDGSTVYHLDVLAPALENYRARVLSAMHEQGRYYPITVTAKSFDPKVAASLRFGKGDASMARTLAPLIEAIGGPPERVASTGQEFMELVGAALRSGEVRSLIQSLIAQINEQSEAKPAAAG
ncbi:MAG: hypothetical protein ACRC33_23330 [Gemmataceae bacterium]